LLTSTFSFSIGFSCRADTATIPALRQASNVRIKENCSTATVYIDNIQVNAHFFTDEEIENDITPNEINSMDDHNKLMDYMTRLSKVLNKTVVLTPENKSDFVLISVDKDEIKINLY
jgi:hypothetical protein